MNRPPAAFGLDLGTTFSAVAVARPRGAPQVVPNREGERKTPSVVLFLDREVEVGTAAARAAHSTPEAAVQLVKRHLGDPGWLREVDGTLYRPQDVLALIVRKLRRDAEERLGLPLERATVTVPAYFGDAQRYATREALELAGVEPLRVINEPTAAALSYGFERPGTKLTAMVFDLGGGTLDTTILELEQGDVVVRASSGSVDLGGREWDDLLAGHLAAGFSGRFGIDPMDDPRGYQELMESVVAARHALSSRRMVKISVAHEGLVYQETVTRTALEEMSGHLLDRCRDLCHLVLDEAGLSWDRIDRVLLTGGASRMPMVRNLVRRLSSRPPDTSLDPDDSVVRGAALAAAGLEWSPRLRRIGRDPTRKSDGRRLPGETSLVDVTSHTLGVVAMDRRGREYVDRIIPKSSPLPWSARETYFTAHDNQTSIVVRVVEGEGRTPEENIEVGRCEIRGIPPRPAGQEVEVAFTYDLDATVTVEVLDSGTQRREKAVLLRGNARPRQELERLRSEIGRWRLR